jgi:hypothetical protein
MNASKVQHFGTLVRRDLWYCRLLVRHPTLALVQRLTAILGCTVVWELFPRLSWRALRDWTARTGFDGRLDVARPPQPAPCFLVVLRGGRCSPDAVCDRRARFRIILRRPCLVRGQSGNCPMRIARIPVLISALGMSNSVR